MAKKKTVGKHGGASLQARRLGALLACGDAGAAHEIARAMKAAGTVTAAADVLGVHRKTLHDWLRIPAVAKAVEGLEKK
jgi:hypothetical protein